MIWITKRRGDQTLVGTIVWITDKKRGLLYPEAAPGFKPLNNYREALVVGAFEGIPCRDCRIWTDANEIASGLPYVEAEKLAFSYRKSLTHARV